MYASVSIPPSSVPPTPWLSPAAGLCRWRGLRPRNPRHHDGSRSTRNGLGEEIIADTFVAINDPLSVYSIYLCFFFTQHVILTLLFSTFTLLSLLCVTFFLFLQGFLDLVWSPFFHFNSVPVLSWVFLPTCALVNTFHFPHSAHLARPLLSWWR